MLNREKKKLSKHKKKAEAVKIIKSISDHILYRMRKKTTMTSKKKIKKKH